MFVIAGLLLLGTSVQQTASTKVFLSPAPLPMPAKPPKSVYAEIVKNPTGENGYEDYLRAADALNDPGFAEMTRVIDQVRLTANRPPSTGDPIPDWASGKSVLDLERIRASKYEVLLNWIKDGNSKRVYDPRESHTPATIYRELAYFKRIVRFGCSVARVHFADDDPAGATTILVDEFEFAHNIRQKTSNSDLAGIACESIVFAALEPRLSAIGEGSWSQITDIARRALTMKPPFIQAIPTEKKLQADFMRELFKDPKKWANDWGFTDAEAIGKLQAMPSDKRRDLEQKMEAKNNEMFDNWGLILEKPESEWMLDEPPADPSDSITPEMFANGLADMLVMPGPQILHAEARNRTQIRLLYLHGLIQEFRMKYDQLPKDLDELKTPAATYDPLSKTKFVYEINGANYELYSKGAGDTGRIDLKWRRPPSASSNKPSEPDIPA